MPPKLVAPSIALKAFSCPRCGALADQCWFELHARTTSGEGPPLVADEEVLQRFSEAHKKDADKKAVLEKWIEDIKIDMCGDVRLKKHDDGKYCSHKLINVHVSRCYSCSEITIWRHKSILFPAMRYEIEPNPDLPADVRADFEEARTILDLSPRGATALLRLCVQKLCKHLGKPGKNINDDVAALVKDGLDPRISQALDIVRVIGNEAVHPGTMNLSDDRATAATLFELVNRVTFDMITHPKEVKALFSNLPADKLSAIARRDGYPS